MSDQSGQRLPATIERLLQEERQAPAPPPQVASRVFRRLGRTLGLSAPVGSLLTTKTYLIAALLAVGAAGWLVRSRSAAAPLTIPRQATPLVGETPALPAVIATAVVASAPPQQRVEPRLHDELARESALLLAARRALVTGATDGALAILHRHARRWPHGALEQEREILFMDALAQGGRRAAEQARAEEFLRRFPGSTLADAARGHRLTGGARSSSEAPPASR
jgi:hypothetical protein